MKTIWSLVYVDNKKGPDKPHYKIKEGFLNKLIEYFLLIGNDKLSNKSHLISKITQNRNTAAIKNKNITYDAKLDFF